MSVSSRLDSVRAKVPEGVTLVAVSKYHPLEALKEAYDSGQRIFGESRVQELQEKQPLMPNDVEWHFIGHLQANKVKYIAPYITLIHAVDTPKLLEEISRQGLKCGRQIPVLLQLHVATEETKYGFSTEDAEAYLASNAWRELAGARIDGIMCMASNVDDEAQIAGEFDKAHEFFLHARQTYFADAPHFEKCSWGMSGDMHIAVRHGANLVRVGSDIFGARIY